MNTRRDGEARKREGEAWVASSFCRALGSDWRLVSQSRPPAPDCVISNAIETMSVELCGYRQQGPHNEAHAADDALKQFLSDYYRGRPALQLYSLDMRYRHDRNGRFLVPRPAMHEAVAEELRDMISRVGAARSGEQVRCIFEAHDSVLLENPTWAPQYTVFRADDFRILEAHCSEVGVFYHPESRVLRPRSSLDSRSLGVDRDEIKRKVLDKLKNLQGYRLSRSWPIWVVLHSDGLPSSARLPSDGISIAINAAMEVLTSWRGDHFDKYWWLDGVAHVDGSAEAREFYLPTERMDARA